MKLKHLFFSSLLLSTAFVACTNEEILENPSVDTKDAIALGEGYAINVVNGIESRAAMGEDLAPAWEEDDVLGGAWFHMVTALDPNDETKVASTGYSEIGNSRQFYSNHPFYLQEGAGTNNGTFEAPTNVFAGAYVLYYPWDATWKKTEGVIPVKEISNIQTMDCTPGNEYDAVNENMFAYGVNKLVPGGTQTQEVKMNQLPVLYQLRFQFQKAKFLDLVEGVAIEKIIVEAENAEKETVLRTEGQIAPASEAINHESYNDPTKDADGNVIADHSLPAAIYGGTTKTEHISVNLLNSDNENYVITELNTPHELPFIFSALPFDEPATKVVFKIVTSNGYVFAAEYDLTKNAAADAIINGTDEAPAAAYEGGQVKTTITLNTQVLDDVVYTAEQFKEAWEEAMIEGGEILYGEDLIIDEVLTYAPGADKKVLVKAHCDNHSLTINGLNVEDGSVEFANPLFVEGDVVAGPNAELKATQISAQNILAEGDATIAVLDAANLTVASSGIVNLSGVTLPGHDGINVDEIIINKANTNYGKVNMSKLSFEDMTNDGIVTIVEDTKAWGTIDNNYKLAVNKNKKFINEGTFNNAGSLTTAAGSEFDNNPGATLNLDNKTTIILINAAAKDGEAAGQVNTNADVTLSACSVNNGIIDVLVGKLTLPTGISSFKQEVDAARINVAEDAKIVEGAKYTAANFKGYIVVKDNAGNTDNPKNLVAYELQGDETALPTFINTLFIGSFDYPADGKIGKKALTNYNWVLNGGTIDFEGMTGTSLALSKFVHVAGNTTIEGGKTLTLNAATNKVLPGVVLTIKGENTVLAGKITEVGSGNVVATDDAEVEAAVTHSVN